MPKWMTFAFALFISLRVFSTEGKDVDQVINRYLATMGGKEELYSMQSCFLMDSAGAFGGKGTLSRLYTFNTFLNRGEEKAGDESRTLIYLPANDDIPRSQAAYDYLAGSAERDTRFRHLDFTTPLIDYAAKGYKAALVGKVNIGGRQTYKVRLTLSSREQIDYYIETKQWWVIRQVCYPSKNGVVEQFDFSNPRKAKQGYVFPLTVKVSVR
jgi:hypothetical protein